MTLVTPPRREAVVDSQAGARLSLGFTAVSAPIDILTPPLFRRTHPAVRGDGEVACITYADPTAPPPASARGRSAEAAAVRGGESHVELRPAVLAHSDDGGAGLSSASGYTFAHRPEEQQSVKQGLLEVLLGMGDGAAGEFGGGRHLPAPSLEEDVNMRLRGVHCDATYVGSPELLLCLVGLTLARRTDAARLLVGCVASIDLSHTALGVIGVAGPPLRFESVDGDISTPWSAADIRFFPDQPQPWAKCPEKVRLRLSGRSLALAYVCPLLFMPGAQNYAVKQLTCTHCQLTDADAEALAAIIGRKPSETHQCLLESVDLSFNYITDAGVATLLRALKKNRTVTSLLLVGNEGVTTHKALEDIEKRLETIRKYKTAKPSWLKRLFCRR